jgi:3-oxoacyl-[acyl-carrier protein] reductase
LVFELGKYGIRVNVVARGWIEADMTIGGKSEEEVEKLREYFRNKTVLHTTGKPEDVAHVVSFLVSEDARYITETGGLRGWKASPAGMDSPLYLNISLPKFP